MPGFYIIEYQLVKNKLNLSQPKTPSLWIDFFQIWYTNKTLCGLSLLEIW